METGRSKVDSSGAPSARSMATSVGIHVLVLVLLMLVSATALVRTAPPVKKELDIVFYRSPKIEVPVRKNAPPPVTREKTVAAAAPGAPAPALKPRPNATEGPDG